MKTNPTCERPECPRTFSDELNFCQLCGATLTATATPPAEHDPYKTVVSNAPPLPIPEKPRTNFDPYKTVVSTGQMPPLPESQPLAAEKLPADDFDAMKTMVADPPSLELPSVSQSLPKVSYHEPPGSGGLSAPLNIPSAPLSEPSSPFNQPPTPLGKDWNTSPFGSESGENPPAAPSFGASPFSGELPPKSGGNYDSPFEPQPYEQPKFTSSNEPPRPTYQEPEQPFGQNMPNNFDQANQWTPPPAPVANWENQGVGQNTPFAPPSMQGQNQTLAIISLVFGILSVCCYIAPVTGLVALITGYMGFSKASKEPNLYGGKGLAIAGMVVGGIFFLIGLLYYIYIIVLVGLFASGTIR